MGSAGAAPRAAVSVSYARAEASRKNGAKSRGPKTPEGKARSSQNALMHGMRAQKYLVLPDEDWAEFAALEATLFAELAPVGALPDQPAPRRNPNEPDASREAASGRKRPGAWDRSTASWRGGSVSPG